MIKRGRHTVSPVRRRDCLWLCKSWRTETPSSSVSIIILRLSLILSVVRPNRSVDIINLALWSAEAWPPSSNQKDVKTSKDRDDYTSELSLLRTVLVSARPASSKSSRAAAFKLAEVVMVLSSLLKLLRSDLNSLNLTRRVVLTLGGRLLASTSIFLIWFCGKQQR